MSFKKNKEILPDDESDWRRFGEILKLVEIILHLVKALEMRSLG